MSLDRRTLLGLVGVVLALFIVVMLRSPEAEDAGSAEVETSFAGAAGSPAPNIASAAGPTANIAAHASAADPLQGSAAGSSPEVECEMCRQKKCTNYEDQGIDMVSGCFSRVDGSQGADTRDPTFVADCTAAVRCAHESHCATSPAGAAACYCGSRSIDDCIERGPSADAPCVEQWLRAARTHDHRELGLRFSDLKYPAGWANFMLECDRVQCRGQCVRGG